MISSTATYRSVYFCVQGVTDYSYKDLTYYSQSFTKDLPRLLYKCYVRKTVKVLLNGKFGWKNVLDFNHECK